MLFAYCQTDSVCISSSKFLLKFQIIMYSNREYVQMLLLLGEMRGNAAAAIRYPNRRTLGRQVFQSVENRLSTTGHLQPVRPDAG